MQAQIRRAQASCHPQDCFLLSQMLLRIQSQTMGNMSSGTQRGNISNISSFGQYCNHLFFNAFWASDSPYKVFLYYLHIEFLFCHYQLRCAQVQ